MWFVGRLSIRAEMRLKCLVVADPKKSAAELTAAQCERLAERRLVATTTKDLLALVEESKPDILLVSLELPGEAIEDIVPRMRELVDGVFVIATYRELSVPRVERLSRLGLDEFIPYPADALQIFRAASRRFNVPFRRHDRHAVTLDVIRADGVTVGRAVDLSEGGLCMSAIHPLSPGESVLIDLPLGDTPKPLRARCNVLKVEGQAPAPVTVHMQFLRLWGPEYRRLVTYLRGLPQGSLT